MRAQNGFWFSNRPIDKFITYDIRDTIEDKQSWLVRFFSIFLYLQGLDSRFSNFKVFIVKDCLLHECKHCRGLGSIWQPTDYE